MRTVSPTWYSTTIFALFHAQSGYLVLGQGDRLVGLAHEAGDAADVADQVPGVVGHDHFDENIAGEDFALDLLGTPDSVISVTVSRGISIWSTMSSMPRFTTGLFDGGLHRVLIAGIGMGYIPLRVISHARILRRTGRSVCSPPER